MTRLADIPIVDEQGYVDRMSRSMIDKLFFLDKIEAHRVLDYGCADGILLKAIDFLAPDLDQIGFDIAPDMIERARKNAPARALLTSDWREVTSAHNNLGATAIVLSSLIHEVYSYGSEEDIAAFWDRVFNSGFEYVIIRDMCVSRTASRPADPLLVARIRQLADPDRLNEWEETWGAISENWSLVHWLLTYRYTDNWARELKENYLPLPVEDLLTKAPARYQPTFFEHYTLPYLRRTVMQDFGVQLQERTHVKIIFELNHDFR